MLRKVTLISTHQNPTIDTVAVQKPPFSGFLPDGNAERVPFLVKGTHNTTLKPFTDIDVYENITTMTKTYKDFIQFLTFKHPVKRRKPGFESRPISKSTSFHEPTKEQIADNKDRSLRRAKQKIKDYALMNDFDKFATFTFDPKKHNAYDYTYCHSKLSKWLQNQSSKHGKFRYIVVSEQMKDGKWHFHALLGEFTGKYYKTNLRGAKNGERQCYKIDSWEKNYGFADMEDISEPKRIANYITKYISKDFDSKAKNAKRYWCSKGLNLPTIAYNRDYTDVIPDIELRMLSSYSNNHVKIETFPLVIE